MSTGYDGFVLYFKGSAENCVALLRDVKAAGKFRGGLQTDRHMELDEVKVHVAPSFDSTATSFEEAQALMSEVMTLARKHGLA